MAEVKFTKLKYFSRENIKSMTYNPEEVKFINGIGVAKATIHFKDGQTQECYGLINELGEEIYHNNIPFSCERNLMFIGYNSNIKRIGKNAFLCEVLCGNENYNYIEIRLIKIVNGIPTLQRVEIDSYEMTDLPNLVIINNGLYDVENEKFITPYYSHLHYLGNKIFSVKDIISTLDKIGDTVVNRDTAQYDYFHFRINEKGERIDSIFSQLEAKYYLTRSHEPYEDVKERRKKELVDKEAKIIAGIARLTNERK